MEDDCNQYLFVYGTLRRCSDNDMRKLLELDAEFLSCAWFNGKLFKVTYYPCAIPSVDPSDRVYGELYRLKSPKYILEKLDDYEECSDKYPDPKEYIRESKLVHASTGDSIRAWIYIYNRSVEGLVQIMSGDFFGEC